MKKEPTIIVLCGAVSPEREVSLRSGAACAEALKAAGAVAELHVLDENKLPEFLDARLHVVFPVIHGDYGEDGTIQAELEARGFAFAGCDSAASRLCIDKVKTKRAFKNAGVPVILEVFFNAATVPSPSEIFALLGTDDVVIKPADKGSSVGLHLVKGEVSVASVLAQIRSGNWMVEARLYGREMTIGILDGAPMGIVEIVPRVGTYDYQNKYTAGATEYRFPAAVAAPVAAAIEATAQRAFMACGCRDFARADFILRNDTDFVFLEINTMPGMTATSLLPKSASCQGLDFSTLVQQMISPALQRFHAQG